MDLKDLIPRRWLFESQHNGDWEVKPVGMRVFDDLSSQLDDEKRDPAEVVRALMALVLTRPETDAELPNVAPTADELSQFTNSDINSFAQQLTRERAKRLASGEELLEGDNPPHTLVKNLRRSKESARQAMEAVSKSLQSLTLSPVTGIGDIAKSLQEQRDQMGKSYGSAGDYLSNIGKLQGKPLKIPEPLPHPANTTNQLLSSMTGRLDNLISYGEATVQTMNIIQTSALEFVEKFAIEAKNNSEAAKNAIRVGQIAIGLAMAQIIVAVGLSVYQSSQDSSGEIQAAITASVEEASKRYDEATSRIVGALHEESTPEAELLRGIGTLLQEQREREQAILKALARLAPPAGE